jgi:exodeoxyribonuclease VII small subunit
MDKVEFDFEKAMAELEKIAEKVEDPQTGLGEIDEQVKRSKELIKDCRGYLRAMREKVAALTQEEAALQIPQEPQMPQGRQGQWPASQGQGQGRGLQDNDGLPF